MSAWTDRSCTDDRPGWRVNPTCFTQGLDKAKGFAFLLERIRRLAKSQRQAAEEWFRWIHFGQSHGGAQGRLADHVEIARATASDQSNDNLPAATHDVKLVWAFMKQGFTDPPLLKHFPSNPDPALLPTEAWALVSPSPRDLDKVLQDTFAKLSQPAQPQTPTPAAVASSTLGMDDSADSSNMLSTVHDSPAVSRRSSASSQDTVEKRQPVEESLRYPAEEPLVWAKDLVKDCATLFQLGAEAPASRHATLAARYRGDVPRASRQVGSHLWAAHADLDNGLVYIGCGDTLDEDGMSFAAYTLPEAWSCEALSFFDDVDLVLVICASDERLLVTVAYADLGADMVKVPGDWTAERLSSILAPTVS